MNIPEAGVLGTSQRYFFTPSSLAQELFYYPTRAGRYFCDRRYHFDHRAETAQLDSHRRNLMLICVCRGELRFVLDGEAALARPGQIALFDCQRPHEYSAADGTEFRWLLFNGANAGEFCTRIWRSRGRVFTPGGFPALVREIDLLTDSCAAGERLGEPACSQLIHRLLCGLLLWGEAEEREDGRVGEAVSFICRNLSRAITLEEVAAAAGLSPAHFSRLFKGRTGCSPYEYILLRRIDEAKYLLASTRLPVREVAGRVGYGSAEHFIHSFQKKVGVTPGAFRKAPV